jgi:hypothetical protein
MNLKQTTKANPTIVLGYVLMYFIFTTILFFILVLLKKLPDTWTYFHVITVTLTIILVGKLIRWFLK